MRLTERSLLAGISSGIEPVYQLSYKRRRKVDKGHPNVSFTDKSGDCWEEYTVYHREGKESFYKGSTSYEINPLARIKMQGGIQKFVDHSISSTLNLPKETTEQQVSDIYIAAWKEGLKGVTIYRDGCRDGVLISKDSKPSATFNYNSAPKRPKELTSVLHTTRVNGIPYAIIIGLLEEKPYEIFCLPNYDHSHGDTIGTITKIKKGHFKFSSKQFTIEDINNQGEISERRMNLLLSGILRHGAHPKYLIKWIDKANWDITAYANAVKRIIRKYIRDEELGSNICPQCKENTLIYEGGCTQCTNPECGYGGCS